MTSFAERPLGDLLADLAAPRPAPAGGSAAAWACAIAAGLVEMAAAIGGLDVPRARMLRVAALELAERDAAAYAAALAGGDVASAADPPLALAQAAAEVADLAVDVARRGKPTLRGDAVTAALLAEAAAVAAARLVEINLAGRPADARREAARAYGRRAAAARAAALDA